MLNLQIKELKAALSNREYQIITDCALSNISETPRTVPSLKCSPEIFSDDVVEQPIPLPLDVVNFESHNREEWITLKVSVTMDLVELCLHSGVTRDAPLATLQVSRSSSGTILFCACIFVCCLK